ncbi:MAG: sigma-70 family RNA polymerase sigma factor [Planctomycetota bacterium]
MSDTLDIASQIGGARNGDFAALGKLLQRYRAYLSVLARTQMDGRLRQRVSPSDVVQETMLKAHRGFGDFRGVTERELLVWLRQILVNNLAAYVERHLIAAKRDVRREVSIDRIGAALEKSTIQLAAIVPADWNTPSRCAQHREESVLLADRMAALPADYREVLILRNLQGLPFSRVAESMNRTEGAVRMLWLRAIERLRHAYGEESDDEQ